MSIESWAVSLFGMAVAAGIAFGVVKMTDKNQDDKIKENKEAIADKISSAEKVIIIEKIKEVENNFKDFIDDEYKDFKRVTNLFVTDSCDKRMRSLADRVTEALLDKNSNFPKYVPMAYYEKKHEELWDEIKDFRKEIGDLRKDISIRDDGLTIMLKDIHKQVIKNNGGS